jgi:hypothetical protein
MSTPEAAAKHKIQHGLKLLRKQGLRHKLIWNAGASYGEPRVDCDGPVEGIAVAIEVKRFDGKGRLSGRQKLTLKEYAEAGAEVFVIDSHESMQAFFAWCRAKIKPENSVSDADAFPAP